MLFTLDNEKLLNAVMTVAKDAGEAILFYYGQTQTALNVTRKEDNTLLTDADLAAHKVVVDGLKALTPDVPILSEEGRHCPYDIRRTWDRYWLVDPLDGTRGFVERCGEFTVNIALIERGKSVLGVLYIPVKSLCYYALAAGKAYKQEKKAKPICIKARKMNWDDYGILLGNAKHTNPLVEKMYQLKNAHVLHVNSAYKFGLLAEGLADCYPRLGKTSEWDTAAAQVIVEAAGGAVVDFNGEPLQYNAKSSLINPPFLAVGDPSAIPTLIKMINAFKSAG